MIRDLPRLALLTLRSSWWLWCLDRLAPLYFRRRGPLQWLTRRAYLFCFRRAAQAVLLDPIERDE